MARFLRIRRIMSYKTPNTKAFAVNPATQFEIDFRQDIFWGFDLCRCFGIVEFQNIFALFVDNVRFRDNPVTSLREVLCQFKEMSRFGFHSRVCCGFEGGCSLV